MKEAEGKNLGKDTMKSEDRDQSKESEERNQSTELHRKSNSGTGVDRLEMSLIRKHICTWTTSPVLDDEREIIYKKLYIYIYVYFI